MKSKLKKIIPPFFIRVYRKFYWKMMVGFKVKNNFETEVIKCPYCNENEHTPFRKNADIVKCASCGLVYLRTRMTSKAMYEFYQSFASGKSHMTPPYKVEEAKDSPLRREFFVNESIYFQQKKKGVWLDIGCGWGALLMYVRELGYVPIGIEVTRNCVDFATMQLQIPVSNSQFTDSVISASSCQVISMVHVLEHLPNPKETLSKIFKTLAPGGVFCGMVPNIESFCSLSEKENWLWLDPNYHYVHYSPDTIKQKLEEAGFVIEKIYTCIGDYDRNNLLQVVKKQFPLTKSEGLEQIDQKLEMEGKGEEIRFFASKPS
jgi:2-polyprenyl-3-methyl-5-hydroxy-6-metoxy-1,4-benzoquinol methylase